MAFLRPATDDDILASHTLQIIYAWEGDVGKGQPLDLSEVDSAEYALKVRNKSAAGLCFQFSTAAGNPLLRGAGATAYLGQNIEVTAGKTVDGVDLSAHTHTGLAGHGPQIPTGGIADNAVGAAQFRESSIRSVVGKPSSVGGAGNVEDIQAANDHEVLRRYGDVVGFGQIHNDGIRDATIAEAKLVAGVAAKLVTGGNAHDHLGGDGAAISIAALSFDPATQTELNAHGALAAAGTHGSTTAATANKLVHRDAAGRGKVVAPAVAGDIALKSNVDAVQTNLNTHKTAATLDHPDSSVTAAKIANRTRKFFVPVSGGQNLTNLLDITTFLSWGIQLQDLKLSAGYGYAMVPRDFVSGMTVKPVIVPEGNGNIFGQTTVEYGQCGEALGIHSDTSGAFSAVAVTTGDNNCIHQATLTNENIGDILRCTYERDAVNAADTIGLAVWLAGFIVEYTADS